MQLGLGAGATTTEAKWVEDKRLVRPEQLDAFVRWVQAAPELVLDYETTGTDTRRGARAFMAGFYAPDKGAKVLDLRLTGDHGQRALKDAVSGRKGVTIVHNGKNEVSHSRALGFEVGGTIWDNQAASFALNEEGDHGQKELVEKLLKRQPVMARAVHDWMTTNLGTYKRGHERNPNELEVPYNCEDVTDCWDLYRLLRPQVEKAGMLELVQTDGELTRVVAEMECRGLPLDMEAAERNAKWLGEELGRLYKTIRQAAGRDLDVGSHSQLFGLLYGSFGLPMHGDLEKKGKLDDDVLTWMLTLPEVRQDPRRSELISAIRDHRERTKLKDTYLLPWLYEHQVDGYLYPNLNLTIARTRRFTADSPNLQNVPARGELAALVRAVILARMGWTTYSKDYSQVEYRAFTHYCGEPGLVRGYKSDPKFDIHTEVGRLLSRERKDAKHLNFGLLYGMGLDKLARSLQCTKAEAKKLLDAYYARIPTIQTLKRQLEQEVRARGYVRDVFGGRRHLTSDLAYRAVNSICQMTAANLIRRAMVRAYPIVKRAGGYMLLQIHDELQFELPGTDPREHKQVLTEVGEAMAHAPEFRVPMNTDTEFYTTNWNEMEAVP